MQTVHSVHTDGAVLHVVEAGPPDGDVVLLIHGWPDSVALWRFQIEALAAAGYRVIAADQRGFGQSSMPVDPADYHVLKAMTDQGTILDDLGVQTAHIVGHDWGAAVAWLFTTFVPERTLTLTAISVGHPNAFRRAGLAQLRRSFYMLLFQFDGVAETWLSDDDYRNFRQLAGDDPENERQVADLRRPGRLTASLGWYRSNMAPRSLIEPEPDLGFVQRPTLGVMGADDPFLGPEQMEGSEAFVASEFKYELLKGARHWVPTDKPERLNGLLLDWFVAHRPG